MNITSSGDSIIIITLINKNNEKRMVAMMTIKYKIITIVVPILT